MCFLSAILKLYCCKKPSFHHHHNNNNNNNSQNNFSTINGSHKNLKAYNSDTSIDRLALGEDESINSKHFSSIIMSVKNGGDCSDDKKKLFIIADDIDMQHHHHHQQCVVAEQPKRFDGLSGDKDNISLSSLSDDCSSCNSSVQSMHVQPQSHLINMAFTGAGSVKQDRFDLNLNFKKDYTSPPTVTRNLQSKPPTLTMPVPRPKLELSFGNNNSMTNNNAKNKNFGLNFLATKLIDENNNEIDFNDRKKILIRDNDKSPVISRRPVLNGLSNGGLCLTKEDKLKSDPFFNKLYNFNKPIADVQIKKAPLDCKSGKLKIDERIYEINTDDIEELCEIGRGEYGFVMKALHKPTMKLMALKKINASQKDHRTNKELEIAIRCNTPFIVKFYGFKFNNLWEPFSIFMEIMDTSLDKFYKHIYDTCSERIPEQILGQIVLSTLNALIYLKESLKTIHRDVKPSNILLNREGEIKLCDFGISGSLVDSMAHSHDVGCRVYMSPERILPIETAKGYDIRSDVWSLGITCFELATGEFPYPNLKNTFNQLAIVVDGPAPRLTDNYLSENFKDFVNICLEKNYEFRPKYKDLLAHKFLIEQKLNILQVSNYVAPYIDTMKKIDEN